LSPFAAVRFPDRLSNKPKVLAMTQGSSADWELAIVLPLGVVANQLRRIEEQLRFLDMKALSFARERENGTVRGLIEARLEHINEVLRAITDLTSNIEADIQPESPDVTRASIKDETVSPGSYVASDDVRSSHDTVDSQYSRRKSYADRDD
jgi:hypothetical protein